MKAMLVRRYGGPEVFEFGEAPMPTLGPKDILVRVRSSSVNPFDCAIRRGDLRAFIRLKLPAILGVDVAGEVVETGGQATKFQSGDPVYAYVDLARGGGYGEFIAIPEAWAAKVPKNLPMEHAGVVPGVALTAYEAFVLHAPVQPRMRVLVVGAAGGVGTFAVQIAKARGAHVTGVCSGAKAAHLRRLGADAIVDYTREDILESTARFDVILHAVRNGEHGKIRRLLKPEGRLVVITGTPLTALGALVRNRFSKQKTIAFYVKNDGENLAGVSKLIQDNQIRPVVEKVYSWRELAEAHRRVETGRVTGKLAIRLQD